MSPRKLGPKKTRFTLLLPEEAKDDLVALQHATGKGAVAEVVRDAIAVHRALLEARASGVELFFEDTKTGEKGRIWLLPAPAPLTKRK